MRRISLSLVVTLTLAAIPAAAQEKKAGATAKAWTEAVDKAVAYYRSGQAEDGAWSKSSNPGITALVVRALLRSGKVKAGDPMIVKALKNIEAMADPETGHLAGKGSKSRLHNYLTSVNLLALHEADPKGYASIVDKAKSFLKGQPYSESRGKEMSDPYYGGFGYDASTRPDMSNTVFCLEALRAAGLPADDPLFRKALVYVSRSQNLKSEFNDQPWADKFNDGSFIYGAGPAGAKGKDAKPDDPRPGYGSITCSGLVALMHCGVKKDDVRFAKALDWLQKEYSVERNPVAGDRGYYLYTHMLAAALDRAGVDVVMDAAKKPHDWRSELVAALHARQRADGAWANKSPAWLESNPDLATAWALMALSYARPREK